MGDAVLTKAQDRCLQVFARPGIHSVTWGHKYGPPKRLVEKGLLEQFGYRREGPVYYITEAGRSALNKEGGDGK